MQVSFNFLYMKIRWVLVVESKSLPAKQKPLMLLWKPIMDCKRGDRERAFVHAQLTQRHEVRDLIMGVGSLQAMASTPKYEHNLVLVRYSLKSCVHYLFGIQRSCSPVAEVDP